MLEPEALTPVSESPPRTPQRALGRPKSPIKLTPLERKERDRQRQRDQAKRRLQAIKDRDAQALALLSDQHKSLKWHQQERIEEELILRQLERDLVDPQRCNPAAVGYRFWPARDARDVTKHSPVFKGYSPVLCPPSQASHLLQDAKTPAAALIHPAFAGHCIAKHADATQISPVFFKLRYVKIPLDEIDISEDDGEGSDGGSSDEDDEDEVIQTQEEFLAHQQGRPGGGDKATIAKLSASEQLMLCELLKARFAADAGEQCLVCRGSSALGCPGCFQFSDKEYKRIQSAKSTQRLKTPKTHGQESEEREVRHTGLRLKLMGYGRRGETGFEDDDEQQEEEDEKEDHRDQERRPKTTQRRDYYVNVLADIHAVRKHRTVIKNYVTLHIKTLPVGSLITLQVDLRSSIAYVYELYRANVDSPNRKIHILLPTTAGLFYLNEVMENATDTRCGLVNGEFLVEDFNLRMLHGGSTSRTPASPLTKRNLVLRQAPATEFMLFSVAILSETNTPQLVTNFLQQNFHFDDDTVAQIAHRASQGLRIEYATVRLPPVIAQDLYQTRLIPHVHSMKQFATMSKQLERLEAERERERLLWIAYQEKKLARLEQKKKQHQRSQGDGHRSRKVVRAMAYLDFVLESTSNAQRARVAEERLRKLWQCSQFLEEWKLCKNGRLIDAENTADTRQLVQRHMEATVAAFDKLLERAPGSGPLVYPIQCVGSTGKQRLVVKIGMRLGCSPADNQEYGLVLDLDQDLAAVAAEIDKTEDAKKTMKKRGFTKKQLLAMSEDEAKKKETAASWRCSDWEWKPRPEGSASQSALLFSGSDLLRPPFLGFPWPCVATAYTQTLQSLVFQLAKLDEFNALARVLQSEDAQLGKAQIEKWCGEVESFHSGLLELAQGSSPLLKTSVLLKATQRVLQKQGPSLLKKRLRQRRQKMREREQELERLRQLQEELSKPKLSVVQQLKQKFIVEKVPKIHALLELTPAEKLKQKAEQLLGAIAGKASRAAQAAKKEYNVRAL